LFVRDKEKILLHSKPTPLSFCFIFLQNCHALQAGRSRVDFPTVSLEFFNDIILPAALWLWGRLSL
jgi:hypothetical protein